MNRLNVLLLCGAIISAGAAKQLPHWEEPYMPSRLEWLVLQCNLNHRQRHAVAHATFLAMPPNKVEVVIKLTKDAKKDKPLHDNLQKASTDYVKGMAKLLGWTDPLDVEAVEVTQ